MASSEVPACARKKLWALFESLDYARKLAIAQQLSGWLDRSYREYDTWRDAFITLMWRGVYAHALDTGRTRNEVLREVIATKDIEIGLRQMHPETEEEATQRWTAHFDHGQPPIPRPTTAAYQHRLPPTVPVTNFDPGHPSDDT